jgi:2-iminobutanoate/2-iminopropanoate deaminase
MLENRKRHLTLYATLRPMRNLCAILVLLALPLAAEKKAIVPPEFAGGTLPYSPGVLVDGTLYCAGQTGQDLKTKQVPADFESEVKLLLNNIGLVLKAAGMTFKDAVSVQVYLTDIELFPRMNAVYATYFPEPRPARTTVGISKLAAAGAHVEITVTAHK